MLSLYEVTELELSIHDLYVFIFWAGRPVDRHWELMVTHKVPDLPTCLEEKHSLGESSTSCKEELNTNDT